MIWRPPYPPDDDPSDDGIQGLAATLLAAMTAPTETRGHGWDARRAKPCCRCGRSVGKTGYAGAEWARAGDAGRVCRECET